jgi:hypothetical protein
MFNYCSDSDPFKTKYDPILDLLKQKIELVIDFVNARKKLEELCNFPSIGFYFKPHELILFCKDCEFAELCRRANILPHKDERRRINGFTVDVKYSDVVLGFLSEKKTRRIRS